MPDASGGHLRGVLSMLIAVAAFCFMDASMKLLAPHYPPMQVAAMRGITSLPLVLAWALVDGGPTQLIRVRWSLHLVRGVIEAHGGSVWLDSTGVRGEGTTVHVLLPWQPGAVPAR